MKGYILISVMAMMLILSTSLIYSAREGAVALKRSVLLRDKFQLEALTDAALHAAEELIVQLPQPIIQKEWGACTAAPCVFIAQNSNYFLTLPLSSWLATHHPWAVRLPLAQVEALMVLELVSKRQDPKTAQNYEYLRGTIVMYSPSQQSVLRLQAHFERATFDTLNYEHTAAGLATLKGGSHGKVRRLALRRM